MRAFPLMPQRRPHLATSSKGQRGPVRSPASHLAPPAANLQHAIGNQGALRLSAAAASPQRQGSSFNTAIDPAVRLNMERHFGCDFTQVRIHADAASSTAAETLGARAYTFGQDIWFGQGAYDPNSAAGRKLIAHELAHTIQQRGTGAEASGRGRSREQEAERAAQSSLTGNAAPAVSASGAAVARQPLQEMPPSIEWVDGQIALVLQQLQMPILPLPMRAMLEERLMELRMRRAQLLSGAGSGPPIMDKRQPQPCDVLGKARHTPEAIDQELQKVDLATVRLIAAVTLPGPMTYEIALPSLHALQLQKVKLLRCGAGLGPRFKAGAAPQPETAETRYAKQAQAALEKEAHDLGEKQAKREEHEDWTKLSHNEMVGLDIIETHLSAPSRRHLGGTEIVTLANRDPMISTIENEVNENPKAKEVYDATLWDLTNQPEPESLFHKVVSGGICEHIEPCKSNLEKLRADKAAGMSEEEALNNGIFRTLLFGATMMSESGPGDLETLGPKGSPGPRIAPLDSAGGSIASKIASKIAKGLDRADVIPGISAGDAAAAGKPVPTISAPAPKNVAPAPTPDPVGPSTDITPTTPKASTASRPAPTVATKSPATDVATPPTTDPVPVKTQTPVPTTKAPTPVPAANTPPVYPPVTVLPHASRPFTPDYAANATPRVDVRNQYTFREFVRNGKTYRQGQGRLGMPDEVTTHRDPAAQAQLSHHTGDDAGHLFGNTFGAPGGPENLTLQNWILNRFGNFRKLEQAWAALRRKGVEIDVQVTDVTRNGEDRPFMRNVQWTETAPDGSTQSFELDFANTTTARSRARSGGTTSGGGN